MHNNPITTINIKIENITNTPINFNRHSANELKCSCNTSETKQFEITQWKCICMCIFCYILLFCKSIRVQLRIGLVSPYSRYMTPIINTIIRKKYN